MKRWVSRIEEVQAAYVGVEPWSIKGKENGGDTDAQAEAMDRIVVRPTGSAIVDDPVGYFADFPDTVVAVRMVKSRFEIWAPDDDAAEDRAHGLLIALRTVGNSNKEVADISEEWLTDEGVTAGGTCVVITCAIAIPVLLASDTAVLEEGAPLNEGAPRDPVESATSGAYFGANYDGSEPDLVISKERET